MEELDAPNEFFYDKAKSELYLYYNGTGAPPSSVEVPMLSELVVVQVRPGLLDQPQRLDLQPRCGEVRHGADHHAGDHEQPGLTRTVFAATCGQRYRF